MTREEVILAVDKSHYGFALIFQSGENESSTFNLDKSNVGDKTEFYMRIGVPLKFHMEIYYHSIISVISY